MFLNMPSLNQICLPLQVCCFPSPIAQTRGPIDLFLPDPHCAPNFSFRSAAAPNFRALSFLFLLQIIAHLIFKS